MNIRRTLLTVTAIALAAITVLSPMAASAAYVTTETTGGDINRNVWVPYHSQRTTDAWPYRISFNKTDDPALDMQIRGCGIDTYRGYGIVVEFPNADPTGDLRLRETSTYGLTFCLNAKGRGFWNNDSFTGDVSWWVQ